MYKWLQVDATTKCNAWCPGCDRNQGGYGLTPGLVLEDLNENVFESHLKNFPDLEVIDFCGTFGDAIAASNIKILTELAKAHAKKILIRTNGSLRNVTWWTQYGHLLKDHDHEVWFCLDGLADTHSIYRQGTNFDTIINNAKSFMSAGGVAVWQFIPWAHNQHQIKDCIRMSQKLGFKRFELVRNVRKEFLVRARDYRSGNPITILPWDRDKQENKYGFNTNRHILTAQECRHLSQPSIYLNANGKLSPCCFLNINLCADTLEELPDIANELLHNPRKTCINCCSR